MNQRKWRKPIDLGALKDVDEAMDALLRTVKRLMKKNIPTPYICGAMLSTSCMMFQNLIEILDEGEKKSDPRAEFLSAAETAWDSIRDREREEGKTMA